MFKIDTVHGNIHYEENIIRKIVEKGVDSFGGKVLLYNNSKRLLAVGSGRKPASSLQTGGANTIRINDDGEGNLDITVYLVVRFGASISKVTDDLLDYIYEYVERITGIIPVKVTVNVTGVLSKNLVRRNIEVSR
ncbi:MAG: Asp23/Gls24 family envelope stress response protein [Firmicutes bacterium]|nr:Asp23/Gls24 family envelope stress response protein [Bacillota bacterium]